MSAARLIKHRKHGAVGPASGSGWSSGYAGAEKGGVGLRRRAERAQAGCWWRPRAGGIASLVASAGEGIVGAPATGGRSLGTTICSIGTRLAV